MGATSSGERLFVLRQTIFQSTEIDFSFGAELFSNLSRAVRVVVRRVFFRFGDF